MENWFRDVGKTVLLEALGDACDRINSSFKTAHLDFDSYTQDKLLNLTAELDTLRHRASRVSRLEEENVKLRNEVKALKEAGQERNHTPNAVNQKTDLRTPLAPKSINQLNSKQPSKDDINSLSLADLQSEYSRIEKKYGKLHGKYFDLHNALNKSNDLLRERTTMYHQWVDHAKQLGEQSQKRAQRIKKLEARLAEACQEPLNLSFSSDGGSMDMAMEPTIPTTIHSPQPEQLNQAVAVLANVPRRLPAAPTRIEDARRRSPSTVSSVGESNSLASTSGMSNILESNEEVVCLPSLPRNREITEGGKHVKLEPSSDTPVVVSECSVRKRKYDGNNGSDKPALRRVKIESSPEFQSTVESRRFTPQESVDFDTEYRRVETPRKHTKHQRIHNVHLSNSDYNDVEVQDHDRAARIMPHVNTDQHNQNPASDMSKRNSIVTSPAQLQGRANSALPSHNTNQALPPRSNTAFSSTRPSVPRGLTSLAEIEYPTETITSSGSKPRLRGGALGHLLDKPSRQQANESRHHDFPAQDGQSSNLYLQLPKRRELPFGKDGRKREGLIPKTRSDVLEPAFGPNNQDGNLEDIISGTEKRKMEVPLRQTPKSKLRLDDFKINPHANEGYNYAFTDVIRRKDDRTCLQGCVKENCCGHKFRALAQSLRASTRPDEFHRLLESYLGDDCHRLSAMSKAEKETLWVEAKMRELANASGKHRHRYPRMPTPPGFWRTDFPSTQEGEEYNEEAAKLELEIIDERYREAMRPGGLWIFRDE
ncbi:DNA repair protein endonuclease SAE2/CtIP C-terminus-domain-containing protein [Xylaria bambusicola]|uniref:DNA repair protein endonuclease SAE2/CtIP C-terminus-domain-containing protein n=1 Tax=Xylaria bambusicola TaxID=326684 RepID=UPI0020077AFA|nr:DNA repair protein endonuclease SAE2/CtIP C-terminus-domain-containing protein [Xylaria bambusicola]KAI0514490.1 DNA repair protein endonuclease SAE2/CtIP C-terminus-domain-containing protein [Xylaria bambusicola]